MLAAKRTGVCSTSDTFAVFCVPPMEAHMPVSVVIDLDEVVTIRALLQFLAALPADVNLDEDLRYTGEGGSHVRGLAFDLVSRSRAASSIRSEQS